MIFVIVIIIINSSCKNFIFNYKVVNVITWTFYFILSECFMTKQDWKDAYKDIIVVDIWGTKLRDKHTSLGLKYTHSQGPEERYMQK